MGLTFPNPVGLAAGFDKTGEAASGLLRLGFGFIEVGTVTPRPQAGNPKPRLFRLVKDDALINRMGFNNPGQDAVYANLTRRARRGIVGVNIGANRDSDDRVADYVAGVKRFADVADYIAINVSSPNTPGLRDLQEKEAIAGLLMRVAEARAAASNRVPILLKIAPDLNEQGLIAICDAAISAGIDGMIVTNTTIARDGLSDAKLARETGGLSGRPLFERSTAMVRTVREIVGTTLAIVGSGGIDSAETAKAKLDAGADLIQVYTGMIYRGPDLPGQIVKGLARQA